MKKIMPARGVLAWAIVGAHGRFVAKPIGQTQRHAVAYRRKKDAYAVSNPLASERVVRVVMSEIEP